jgi:hypothetical protein
MSHAHLLFGTRGAALYRPWVIGIMTATFAAAVIVGVCMGYF